MAPETGPSAQSQVPELRPPATTSPDGSHGRSRSVAKGVAAIALGLAGSVGIWIATPYNNFVMRGSFISDSYLPIGAIFIILVLVLGVNPLLRRFAPGYALGRAQLAIVAGMLLVASHIPGQGLMRELPYAVGKVPLYVSQNKAEAEAFHAMKLDTGSRAALFPDRIGFQKEVPHSLNFVKQLPGEESIPWGQWAGPLLTWGVLMLFAWLMTVGLAMVVFPQWRRNERLAFPLLAVQQSLIEEPEDGRLFAPLFRTRSFWVAVGAVFLLHFLAGMKNYYPDGVPAIPLKWDLSRFFTEEPLRHLPGHIKQNRIYFLFVGVAFFMPTRISFSIWVTVLGYGLYRVVDAAYFPPWEGGVVMEHRNGAMIALTVAVLWLGRAHWAHVFRCLGRPVRRLAGLPTPEDSDADRRDRLAAGLFTAGIVGMVGWLIWVGVGFFWAVLFVGVAFMISLLITRVVAETGMPFIRIDTGYQLSLVRLFPSLLTPVAYFFSFIFAMLFSTASRMSATPLAAHALGQDESAGPRRQSSLAVGMLALLLVGFVVCGAANVAVGYGHSRTLDEERQDVNGFGTNMLDWPSREVSKLHRAVGKREELDRLMPEERGDSPDPVRSALKTNYSQTGHLLFGAAAAGGLQYMCMLSPRWPLHPIGLLMVHTYYGNEAWASVFIGWLLKVLLLRYGGALAYRKAKPIFLGVIMGEVFAQVFWSIEPVARLVLGLMPFKVYHLSPR